MADDPREAPRDLAQVVDPAALDGSVGSRARIRVEVLAAWQIGDELEIVVPALVACARCDGGGCDGCNRSGALRLSGESSQRVVRVQVPDLGTTGAALRVVQPFGAEAPPEQLIVELAPAPPGAAAPSGVTHRPRRPEASAPTDSARPLLAAAGAAAALAAAAAAIVTSC